MHLSIVCPTPLPPDMGESKAGHCNPNFDPGVRHKQVFVSHICDPGVCHFCIDVSHVNDLGVGQFRCENVNKISFDDACPYKTLTLIMSCHCFEGIKLHFPNISASLCAFFCVILRLRSFAGLSIDLRVAWVSGYLVFREMF